MWLQIDEWNFKDITNMVYIDSQTYESLSVTVRCCQNFRYTNETNNEHETLILNAYRSSVNEYRVDICDRNFSNKFFDNLKRVSSHIM